MKEKKQKYVRKKEVENKTRNNNFAAALDYLKRQSKTKLYQKDLAEMLGVTENTISNIINCRTAVSEDMVTQLQTVSGCVFNLQFLRGQSDVMLAKDVQPVSPSVASGVSDWASVTLATLRDQLNDKERIIASKDETIAAQKRELSAKDEIIATKDALIKNLQQTVASLRADLSMEKGLSTGTSPLAPADPEHSRPTV
jgi:plasmid maintenance system antidote protein VapI